MKILDLYILSCLVLVWYFFARLYLRTEKSVPSWKEFVLLLILPSIGFGNWKYNQEIRQHGRAPYPRNWFIWKKMVPVNCCLLALAGIGIVILFSGAFGLVGSGYGSAQTPIGAGVGFFADMAFGVLLLLLLFVASLCWLLLSIFFVWVPSLISGAIAKRHDSSIAAADKE